jgi:hypothetical protein
MSLLKHTFESCASQIAETIEKPLLMINIVGLDESNMSDIGDLKCESTGDLRSWLDQDDSNRAKLSRFLKTLAESLED